MTFGSRRPLLLLVASVWCWLASCPSALAAYPDKPVRLIVPFPAGGSADFLGRLVAQKLSESLAQQVIVDNLAWRRRQYRLGDRRQGCARWLYPSAGLGVHARHQPQPLRADAPMMR